MQPTVVLHLLSAEGLTGPARLVLSLASQLRATSCRCHLSVFVGTRGRTSPVLEAAVQRNLWASGIVSYHAFDLSCVARTRRVLRDTGAHLLHSHGYRSDIIGYLACRPLHIPQVATVHGWTRCSTRVRLYEKLDRVLLGRLDGVVAVSQAMARSLEGGGVRPERIRVIPNSIEPERFRSEPTGRLRQILRVDGCAELVGSVGRLSSEKGHRFLLQAGVWLLSQRPALHLVLIGDGPEHDNLRNQADRLGIGSRVHLLGQRPDVEDLVADLDVVVFPSLSEGLPIALLEAWCLARPVVATAVGGIPETLSDGENGRLVPPADADALARSVLELLKSPLHAKALGRGGREAALTRHVPGVAATAMIDFYRDVLLERAPQSGH